MKLRVTVIFSRYFRVVKLHPSDKFVVVESVRREIGRGLHLVCILFRRLISSTLPSSPLTAISWKLITIIEVDKRNVEKLEIINFRKVPQRQIYHCCAITKDAGNEKS